MTFKITDFLVRSEASISNSLADNEIRTALSDFGYDQNNLDEALILCLSTKQLNEEQDAEYGDQYLANKNFVKDRNSFDKIYKMHLKLARISFRFDAEARQSLLLSGSRKYAYSEWVIQRETFYNNLKRDQRLKDEIARFVQEAQIDSAIQNLIDLKSLYLVYKNEKVEAQAATEARDDSLDQLKRYMTDFYIVAKIALADLPQKLEKLGYVR